MRNEKQLMIRRILAALTLTGAQIATMPAHAGQIDKISVQRSTANMVSITWSSTHPLDIYIAGRPDTKIADAKLVSANDSDGQETIRLTGSVRPYFLLRDSKDGNFVRAAERLIPLEQGSNFRDIGGYPGAGGKHVRWGMIYRAGATPLLSDTDLERVKALGLRNLVDLRSSEERTLAPTRIDGVPYTAIDYSITAITGKLGQSREISNGGASYRNFPHLLTPQLKLLFAMLARGDAPVEYSCSAGQDRTGFTTAIILSVLGVHRDIILHDYHLSTQYRHPEHEMPKIDPTAHAGNPIVNYLAKHQQDPKSKLPQPLYDTNGKSFLISAFDEIEDRWGSVEKYLENEVGISKLELDHIRNKYLE